MRKSKRITETHPILVAYDDFIDLDYLLLKKLPTEDPYKAVGQLLQDLLILPSVFDDNGFRKEAFAQYSLGIVISQRNDDKILRPAYFTQLEQWLLSEINKTKYMAITIADDLAKRKKIISPDFIRILVIEIEKRIQKGDA